MKYSDNLFKMIQNPSCEKKSKLVFCYQYFVQEHFESAGLHFRPIYKHNHWQRFVLTECWSSLICEE